MRGKVVVVLLLALALCLPAQGDVQSVGFGAGGSFTGGTVANATTFSSAVTFSSTTSHTGAADFAAGTAGAPGIAWTADADGTGTGFYRPAANEVGVAINGNLRYHFQNGAALFANGGVNMNTSGLTTWATGQLGFGSGGSVTISTTPDTALTRVSAGVMALTNGTVTTRAALLGGGAAVASAAALPVPTGRVFHVTGTTNVTSMTSTNFASGACVTIIFDGILTFTDGNNLVLAGNFVTTADDTISLCYDGTNWYETGRSVN